MQDLGQWYTDKESKHLNIRNHDNDLGNCEAFNREEQVVNGVVNLLNDNDVTTTSVNIDECTIQYDGSYATIV